MTAESNKAPSEDVLLLLQSAANNFACFCEEVLRDESSGRPVYLAEHHLEWIDHLDRCRLAGKFAGILAPPASGKSSIVSVGLPLYTLGRNAAARVGVVGFSTNEVKKRIRPSKEIIQSGAEFRAVFPHCRPWKTDKWTETEFTVARRAGIKDPSCRGCSIEAPPMGSRIDLLIGDDVCTYDNTVAEPAMREKVIELWYNGFDTRLSPKSQVVYIGGVIHERDLTNALVADPRFWFIRQSVSEDFSALVQDDLKTGERKTLPLWERAWTPEWLREKHAANPRSFERAYRHKGYSDGERTFSRSAIQAAIRYVDDPAEAPPGSVSVSGMDLSEASRAGSVIVVAAREGRRRIVRHVEAGAWSGDEKARRLAGVKERFGTLVQIVENNALQASIIDLVNVMTGRTLNIEPFRTGKQKADEELGLPALAAEFGQGIWEILFPRGHVVGMGCGCGPCRLVRELEEHPFGSTDCVMALWFARHGLEKFGAVPEAEWFAASRAARGVARQERRESRLSSFRRSRQE